MMRRRDFLQKGALGGSFLALGGLGVLAQAKINNPQIPYGLHYAPHLGMFKHLAGEDPLDQLNFMADQGFTAFEDNELRNRPIKQQEQMATVMRDRGIAMGVFVAHKIYWTQPNLTSGRRDLRDEFLNDIKNSVEVAKRVNATWMTVVPGYVDLSQCKEYQTANVMESLKQAAALLEPHGLSMVLEPLNFKNHPGLFLSQSPQAYALCKAVGSPACKILFDIYHRQVQEGNLIPNIEQCWDEIAYFKVGDNTGRNEPTTGEINYRNLFNYLKKKEYEGIVGMEHGNSIAGAEGERRVIAAYKEVDTASRVDQK